VAGVTLDNVALPAGTVTIKAVATAAEGGANLDEITVGGPVATRDSYADSDSHAHAHAYADPHTDAYATPTAQKLEAEAATLTGGTYKASGNGGFTGTGYADFGGNGSAVQWAVVPAAAGNYKLDVRHANGATTARPLTVIVNGVSVGTLSGSPTGGWDKWVTLSITTALTAGTNTVRLVAGPATGGNVDSLSVTAA
jgi:hypothetical protein